MMIYQSHNNKNDHLTHLEINTYLHKVPFTPVSAQLWVQLSPQKKLLSPPPTPKKSAQNMELKHLKHP